MVTLLDGAIGTGLWEKAKEKVPVWRYNVEAPEIVAELHREYDEAGAEILLANTFGANRIAMEGTGYTVERVVRPALDIAHSATKKRIALSIGPLSKLLEPFGELSEDEARDIFREQIGAGMAGKPDIIFVQTFMDIEMAKIAVSEADRFDVPVFCCMSFDKNGRTMMGNSVDDVIDGLSKLRVDAVGLNCSLGPDLALPVIREFTEKTDMPVVFKPNAGKPTASGAEFDTETFAEDAAKAAEFGVRYIGGCCGTNASYIRKLAEKLGR